MQLRFGMIVPSGKSKMMDDLEVRQINMNGSPQLRIFARSVYLERIND